jgi:hypothetical protein
MREKRRRHSWQRSANRTATPRGKLDAAIDAEAWEAVAIVRRGR